LKIAILTLGIYPFRTGGVEIHSYNHARLLAKSGHDVRVFTKRYSNIGRKSEAGGVPVEALGLPGPFLGPLSFVTSALLHLLRINKRVDVIHVHYGSYFAVPAYLMRLVARKRFVVSCHGYDVLYLQKSRIWRFVQRAVFSRASFMTAASSEIRDVLIDRYGVDKDKVVVVQNGVDEEDIEGARRAAVAKGRRTVIFLGNLRAVKDPMTAIKAFEIALVGRPDLLLTVVGDGPVRGEVERYVDARHLQGSVEMKGLLGHQDALTELSSADVFLMSSLSEGGNPLAMMEAMALGKPIVATAVGGIKDIVVQGENGFMVEPGSPGKLAAALTKVLDDKTLASSLAAKARDASRGFTWERTVKTYERIYDNLGS